MKTRPALLGAAVAIAVSLLLAPGVRADLVFEPGAPDTFENLQILTLDITAEGQSLATSSIEAGSPLTLSYQIGYGDRLYSGPDYTPELAAQHFQYLLEDNVTYLEIWSGEPFTPAAALVESKQVGPDASGTVTFAPLEPGNYFLVYFLSLELRDRAAYCTRYEVPAEECADPVYVTEYPASESRVYFSTPIESLTTGIGEVQPSGFAGHRLLVEGTVPSVSNVLFLPGIKGSRLYRPTDNCDPTVTLSCPGVKLWEPSADLLLRDLFLTSAGGSGRNDIYTKEGDVLSEVLGKNFYASFINQMNALKADGTIADWKPIAYDWRLSLDDIVNKGVRRGEKIYYQEQTSTPYIEQSLKELAASSPTGKVSIVAHSNGGLVTKKLMQRLEANGEAGLVDQIIFVGVPQSGAPQAMAGLLYGYGEALPVDRCSESYFIGWLCALFGSRDVARELAKHSPMAYHLLPSQAYFDQVRDADHPVAKFTALTAYLEERNRYGTTIDSAQELYDFLGAKDGGRVKPSTSDIASANILSANFLNYGKDVHASIDSWVPPEGVEVHQIAGWGMNTIAGVEFYEQKKLFGGYKEMYRPIFVEDGDGVVPVPSALQISSRFENIENYWINLEQARTGLQKFDHANLFEIADVRILLNDILTYSSTSRPHIARSQPAALNEDSEKLLFFLHSPLTLEIYDENGNHTGETEDGNFDENIPNAEYGEFGEVKYIITPHGEYDVVLRGKGAGTFSLDVQKMSGTEITSSITLADVPTTETTLATINITEDLSEAGVLRVDIDGDGTVDHELLPAENQTTVFQAGLVTSSAEDNTVNSSRSTRAGQENILTVSTSEDTTIPAVFAYENLQPTAKVIKIEIDTATDVSLPIAQVLEVTKEFSPKQTQTASVYDAVSLDILNWMGSVLYNLWESLVKIFNGFSKKL